MDIHHGQHSHAILEDNETSSNNQMSWNVRLRALLMMPPNDFGSALLLKWQMDCDRILDFLPLSSFFKMFNQIMQCLFAQILDH